MRQSFTRPPGRTEGKHNNSWYNLAVIRLRNFVLPPLLDIRSRSDLPPNFWAAREQLLTLLSRVAAILGLVTALVSTFPLIYQNLYGALLVQLVVLCVVWVLALFRNLDYNLRGGMLLAGIYILGINELLHFGYSADEHAFFIGFALMALLFFNYRVGLGALIIAVVSLASIGMLIATDRFDPVSNELRSLPISAVFTTCINFSLVVGTLQVGVARLFQNLQIAWQQENEARTNLEQRVIERTSELAAAHEQAVEARRVESEQREYLSILHQTALELLNRRELKDLLQAIVDRASIILDAPYGELLIPEGEHLVARAFTSNQPFLAGDRGTRSESLISWRAYDTQKPVLIDNYSTLPSARTIYKPLQLTSTVDIPILAGQQCLGILSMGRNLPNRKFTPAEVQKGLDFANLIALVLDNANLYSTALREIAERKQAEQELQRYTSELQTQNAELEAFAHTVAHDLKNPLTSLLGYNDLLLSSYDRMPPEALRDFLIDIDKIGAKMTAIINGLLLLASARAQDSITMGVLDMEAIVAELDLRFHQMITETGATISKPHSWPTALGYAPWVEEVWANYLSNALKYGGSPPQITLGFQPAADGYVRFWVHDNGAGLSADEQRQLFTPFTRLHTHRREGHGLGLAIVQQIVNRLGGTAGVQSEPGYGSTFYFTLPIAEQKRAAA
jgi:signal transduction histidine kinase